MCCQTQSLPLILWELGASLPLGLPSGHRPTGVTDTLLCGFYMNPPFQEQLIHSPISPAPSPTPQGKLTSSAVVLIFMLLQYLSEETCLFNMFSIIFFESNHTHHPLSVWFFSHIRRSIDSTFTSDFLSAALPFLIPLFFFWASSSCSILPSL